MRFLSSRDRPIHWFLSFSLILGLLLSFGTAAPYAVHGADWVASEGDQIVNGLSSGETHADAPGEVSVKWNKGANKTNYVSPSGVTVATVDHQSGVRLDTPTLPSGTVIAGGDTVPVGRDDIVDIGVRLTNSGNGPDTYGFGGSFRDGGASWDTSVFLDTDRDSSGTGESTLGKVSSLSRLGTDRDDTNVVLRFDVPDTATIGDTRLYVFTTESLRGADPSPGSDTLAIHLEVDDTGTISIDSPRDGYDTRVRGLSVSGTFTAATPGDSIQVSVNQQDTIVTSVEDGGDWTVSDLTLSGMGDSVKAQLHSGPTENAVLDTDLITINYDPFADTFPQTFKVNDIRSDSITVGWDAFSEDPDTGVGFDQYVVYYDTGMVPDTNSTRLDATQDTPLGELDTNEATISGLTNPETYAFRVGYEDKVGNVSILSEPDTAFIGTPPDITMVAITNTRSDSALLADGSGTLALEVVWENTGQLTGTIQVDTGDISFHSHDNSIDSGFDLSLRSDSELRIPGGTTARARWWLHAPDTGNQQLPGAYEVSYEGSDTRTNVNISSVAELERKDGILDSWTEKLETVSMDGGVLNGEPFFESGRFASDDRLILMVQQGDSSFHNTSLLQPEYGFRTNEDLRNAVTKANEKLQSTLDERFDDTLVNISLWKNRVGGQYLGIADDIAENVRVSIDRPSGNLEDLKVAKLLPESNEWHVIDENPQIDPDRVTFEVSSEERQKGTGFSLFRLVTGPPVSEVGSADETVVYPNPFIPYDGDQETGEYGLGDDQGIFFSTGERSGFPAGTVLKIYTVTGELVAEVRTHKVGRIQWDGRTRDGDHVASGTYVYRITTPDGSEKVGKFSVVR